MAGVFTTAVLKRHLLESVEEMQEQMMEQLSHISSESYIECWKKWNRHKNHCTNAGVDCCNRVMFNTIRSESHCALIKGVGSDVHEHLYRSEPI
jgi:hypothetical protein